MNTAHVDKIANALLYEGYMLYPYRPSIKNRKRWTFGCIHPHGVGMQTECLVDGDRDGELTVEIRFLQLVDRDVARLRDPAGPADELANLEILPALQIDKVIHQSWQEAVERRVRVADLRLLALAEHGGVRQEFAFGPSIEVEPLGSPDASRAGAIVRRSGAVKCAIEVAAQPVDERLFQITVRVVNTSAGVGDSSSWNEPSLESLVSTHIILGIHGGQFVSSIDPPEHWQQASCRLHNEGAFPILVGPEPERGMMLASPIILYDYPEVAAESPGDLFDATEIDEILGLRIMTLTDDEKAQIDSLDERTRAVLMRTHLLPEDDRRKLHGTIRGLKHITEQTD
jgi:hypothetical protein